VAIAPVGSPLSSALSHASAKQVVLTKLPFTHATEKMNGHLPTFVRLLTSEFENSNEPQFGCAVLKAEAECGREISGKDFSCKLIHNSPDCIDGCVLKKCIEKGLPVQDLIFEPNLGKRFFEVSAYPIRNNKGEIDKYVHAFKDVTTEKELENQVVQMQKLESLGTLAGGITHDFKNMIGAILGNVELLQLTSPSQKQQIFINEIKRAGDFSNELSSKLLSFSRKEISEPVQFDVHEVISDGVKLFKNRIGTKSIKIIQQFNSEKSTINGEPSAIQHAIVNLGINAVDAIPKKGELKITTEKVRLDTLFCSMTPYKCLPGDYILIKIHDNGEGIPENISRIIIGYPSHGYANAGRCENFM